MYDTMFKKKPQAATQKTSESDGSSLGAESSSDESLKFDDGLDENLIGDEEDRKRLDQMTEAEREQEMYNRYACACMSPGLEVVTYYNSILRACIAGTFYVLRMLLTDINFMHFLVSSLPFD